MRRRRTFALVATLALAAPVATSDAASDSLESRQWALGRVSAQSAWARSTGSGAVVAIVDTGVDARHPEFSGRLVSGASCIGAGHHSKCTTSTASWDDRNGHGTHVAGIVAAARNGTGTVGVAPDAKIMPVRVLGADATGTSSDVAVGIDYAVARGADVVNLSLAGLPVVSQLYTLGVLKSDLSIAIEKAAGAGVLVVAAAGNDAFPICSHKVFLTDKGVCVGSTDSRDVKAGYSNFGGGLDVVAPGGSSVPLCEENVLSTHLVSTSSSCAKRASGVVVPGYSTMSGTSMAAPHVAGVAALLVRAVSESGAPASLRAGLTARRIAETVDDLGAYGYDAAYGYGRVNARRAVVGDTSSTWTPLPT